MVGVSESRWSDAAQQAVARAAGSHGHVTGVDVVRSTGVVRDGKIVEYHVNVKVAYISKPAKIEK
jgi:dodecin